MSLASLAAELDAADPLAACRDRFVITDPDLIYLDGNSLGRLPKASAALAAEVVDRQWGDRLIRSWGEGWLEAPTRIGAKIAGLVGAQPDEVVVADSTTVNLFKLIVAALRHQRGRRRIVTDDMNFPSDLYALRSAAELVGDRDLTVVPSRDGVEGPVEGLVEAIDGDTALLTLSHAAFKSGYLYDMAALTGAAHERGALVLWDLSHSAGAVPVDLGAARADLAVGCTYKYLNGGPGSPAFLYVRRDLQDALANPIAGWMGRADMFGFALDYRPDPGIRHLLTGSPPTVSTALIEPGVDLLLEAGMDRVREKSRRQTAFLIDAWSSELEPLGYRLNTPRDPDRRGSHVSLGHDHGLRIDLALINEMKVIPDFRAPDNIRLGVSPLYTSFGELATASERLARAVTERVYERYADTPPTVT
jgi:kynureninase